MSSTVQICNMALSHIGAGPLISAINPPDGSTEAGYGRGVLRPGAHRPRGQQLGLRAEARRPCVDHERQHQLGLRLRAPVRLPVREARPVGWRRRNGVQPGSNFARVDDRPQKRGVRYRGRDAIHQRARRNAGLGVTDVIDTGRFTPGFSATCCPTCWLRTSRRPDRPWRRRRGSQRHALERDVDRRPGRNGGKEREQRRVLAIASILAVRA